ncbi:MAG: hypothetical protein HEEMFOPI_01128 [Holosporales bacterium]
MKTWLKLVFAICQTQLHKFLTSGMKFFLLSLFCLFSLSVNANVSSLEKTFLDICEKSSFQDALLYLEQLEDEDAPESFFLHGFFLLGNNHKNSKLANYYFLKAAEAAKKTGNMTIYKKALKALADSFYSGDGFPLLISRALDYYLASAKCGYAPALFNVAIIYKDRGAYTKAIKWMKRYCAHPEAELADYGKKAIKEWSKKIK